MECVTKIRFRFFRKVYSKKKGQGIAEYALILGLIALAVIISLQTLGLKLIELFTSFINMLP